MPRYNFDMSEYQESKSALYDSNLDSCADLSPTFFENEVSYFPEGKKLYLSVCATYEFETLYGLYCDLELPIPAAYQEDPSEVPLLQKIVLSFPQFQIHYLAIYG